jgi:nickel-dependent lactate racemase
MELFVETFRKNMPRILHFGDNRCVELDLAAETVVADWSHGAARVLDDPAAATAAALESPLDLPPIALALTPDDRIVLALDTDTPQASQVAAGAVHALLAAGAEPQQIVVVLSHSPSAEDAAPFLSNPRFGEVQVEVHDPDDASGLCYLASTEENHPLYLNRRVVEADFVLPIGPLRLASSFGYFGSWGGLFPAFADRATRERYQAPGALKSAAAGQLTKEADEAAWLLGVQFVVQVVPGPGDRVLEVLAGSAAAVRQRGEQLCDKAWRRPIPRRANLVVAAISGGPEQQTWENFGRALYAASQAVAENGVIALCTQLRRTPGPALQRMAGLEDFASKQHAVERQTTFDAQAASLLAELLEKKRVYLLSDLEEETVEDLGLAHVESEAEIARLSRQHRSCILLGDAQYAMPQEE